MIALEDPQRLISTLRSTLGRMEAALGAVEEGLVFTDSKGVVEWTNAPFERFVDRLRLQCLGVPLIQLLPARYRLGEAEPLPLLPFWTLDSNGTVTWEMTKAPPRRVIEVSWAPVILPGQSSLIFTFRDQSIIVQAQERLIAARDELEMQVELRTRELKASRDEALAANEAKTRL